MDLNRRTFSKAILAGGLGAFAAGRAVSASRGTHARNIVLAHGLFADGSCWSDVIARLQPLGFNCTSVQNPLTTFPEAIESVERVWRGRMGRPCWSGIRSPGCS